MDNVVVTSQHRCHARDGQGKRCSIVGEHPVITNSKGKPAIAHETPTSVWNVSIEDTLTAPLEGRG